jgi:hypothetical protein
MEQEADMVGIWLGVLLVIGGVLYLASQAIWRGRLSGHGQATGGGRTLEPPRRGVAFLGFGSNWPGLVAIVVGSILLLMGGI